MELSSINLSSLSLNIEHYMTIMASDLGILKLLSFFMFQKDSAKPSHLKVKHLL